MNNGIFSNFDRAGSSIYKSAYSPSGVIQYENLRNSLPRSPLSYTTSIDGIFHLPPAKDWNVNTNTKIVYLVDTSITRRGAAYDTDGSFVLWINQFLSDQVTVDWGDGIIETFNVLSYARANNTVTHYYNIPRLYLIQVSWPNSISSDFQGFPARSDLHNGKCIGILSFDYRATSASNFGGGFVRCDFVPKELPPLITNLSSMFAGNLGIMKNVELWDTSRVTDMTSTFYLRNNNGTSFFNQDLSNWNTSNVTSMATMFCETAAFNNGGSSGINNWDTSKVTNMNGMFGAFTNVNSIFNQPLNNWNTSNVTNMAGMFGSISTTFSASNKSFNQNLNNWNVSKVTNFSLMFRLNTAFNGNLSGWTLAPSGINCSYMFDGASAFTGNGLNTWVNTSGITDTSFMFRNASAFNQNIGNWNVSNVTNMTTMFNGATAFNQNLSSWNVRKVTNFSSMFNGATSFNSSLSGWALGADTAGANCASMFQGASSFVGSGLDSWDVSKINNMTYMFYNASSFNTNIGSWSVGHITSFDRMFAGAQSFNNGGSPSISGWNTGNVTNMSNMFLNNYNFNQPIGSWNVSKVTTMDLMLSGASVFQQDISTWNLAGLNATTSLDNFMLNKNGVNSYSTTNYDALLIGWNNNKLATANGVANWRTDLRPHFGQAKYTSGGAAATARAALVSYGWTITDGGVA